MKSPCLELLKNLIVMVLGDSGCPCWSRGLDKVESRDGFQHEPSHDFYGSILLSVEKAPPLSEDMNVTPVASASGSASADIEPGHCYKQRLVVLLGGDASGCSEGKHGCKQLRGCCLVVGTGCRELLVC